MAKKKIDAEEMLAKILDVLIEIRDLSRWQAEHTYAQHQRLGGNGSEPPPPPRGD